MPRDRPCHGGRCDAAMSAMGLLAMPALFAGPARPEPADMAEEYLDFADRCKTTLRMAC
jgi:hypothetical protein